MIILRPKNVIFERFWPLSKFHFPACSTLVINERFLSFYEMFQNVFVETCLHVQYRMSNRDISIEIPCRLRHAMYVCMYFYPLSAYLSLTFLCKSQFTQAPIILLSQLVQNTDVLYRNTMSVLCDAMLCCNQK